MSWRDKVLNGERLTDDEVKEFVDCAGGLTIIGKSTNPEFETGVAYLILGGIKWKVTVDNYLYGKSWSAWGQTAEAVDERKAENKKENDNSKKDKKNGATTKKQKGNETTEEDKKEKNMTVDKIQEAVEVKGTEGLEQAPRPLTVYGKLMEVQNMLKAPKNQRNNFGNYNYRSCEDILEGVKGLLAKVGAVILLEDNMELLGDRYYIVATATFVDIEDGSKVEVKARAREALTKKGMDESQITGACSSYARKYALNGLLLIDDNKDADTTKLTREEIIEQLIRLEKLNPKEIKYGIKKSLVKIGVNDLEELKKADWDKIEKWVRSKGGNK